jgi:hypothetical protein
MQDRSQEGLGYLAVSLIPASVAVVSQNPFLKFAAALLTIWSVSKAGECFQDTAKKAYYQLQQMPNNRLIQ